MFFASKHIIKNKNCTCVVQDSQPEFLIDNGKITGIGCPNCQSKIILPAIDFLLDSIPVIPLKDLGYPEDVPMIYFLNQNDIMISVRDQGYVIAWKRNNLDVRIFHSCGQIELSSTFPEFALPNVSESFTALKMIDITIYREFIVPQMVALMQSIKT